MNTALIKISPRVLVDAFRIDRIIVLVSWICVIPAFPVFTWWNLLFLYFNLLLSFYDSSCERLIK